MHETEVGRNRNVFVLPEGRHYNITANKLRSSELVEYLGDTLTSELVWRSIWTRNIGTGRGNEILLGDY